jgi:phosphoribosylformimino-5-aminoimidazole carboxamide ribotide isomerase
MKAFFEVIPAVDIQGGKTVQLVGGERGTERYYGDPVECALEWMNQGAKTIHVVDIDGAFRGRMTNRKTIENIIEEVEVEVQVGGGIRTEEDVTELLSMGAKKVILGTTAIKNPDIIEKMSAKYKENIVVSLDSKGGEVVIEGWVEKTKLNPIEAAKKYEKLGAAAILFTDVDVEGKLEGVRTKMVEKMVESVGIPIIASGGVSSIEDLKKLKSSGASAVVVGSALYRGTISFDEIKKWKETI